jgi:phosphocarrier protein HPr
VDAKRIMGVMGLALKQGDEVTLTFNGPDEAEALNALETFLKNNL